ncbi:MAG: GHKL domain-containing protein [Lachnospiraceae bacterium]|nr:GHKL domain-containing protein [Lachnospiraceae bacterium]
MIKKLKKKFIILATVSMLALMAVLILVMNLINYSTVVAESDKVIEVLPRSMEPFDGDDHPIGPREDHDDDFWDDDDFPRGMSPEVMYEARYFAAVVSSDGTIKDIDISRIISVDRTTAEEYVQKALSGSSNKGFIGQFRYMKMQDGDDTRIVFLDCGRRLEAFNKFMLISILIGVAGCVIVFLVFLFAAGRIIRPISESYEKQKRFITDAGHEIKTPLTIIAANVDLLREDIGENESLDDISSQTKRLAGLTNDLVYLSKMEEADRQLVKVDFPVSDLISETAGSFQAVAASQKKDYRINVQPGLTMNAAPEEIERLASILIENAMKYSPEGGNVTIDLQQQKKNIVLSVSNITGEEMSQKDLSHLFDRFYRTDKSRNSETGGHGIGLSIAQAITEAHGGRITAAVDNDSVFNITAVIPQ